MPLTLRSCLSARPPGSSRKGPPNADGARAGKSRPRPAGPSTGVTCNVCGGVAVVGQCAVLRWRGGVERARGSFRSVHV